MGKKVWRKALAGILSLTLIAGGTGTALFSEDDDAGIAMTSYAVGTIRIDKKYTKVDEPLKIDNAGGYTLKYYVGGDEVSGDDFRLKAEWYEKWIEVRAYDVPEPTQDDEPVAADRVYFSKLPVLYINTDDGEDITSKEEYKTGTMTVQSNERTGKSEYSGKLKIKGRGNSSWKWPKKSFRLKLDSKADLFGMGKNKNWVLISNYLDECFLRNKTAYDFAKEIGLDSMECRWTDVVLNGEYAGNYLLCEQIRVGKNRVDIFDWESEAEDIAEEIAENEEDRGQKFDKAQEKALEEQMKSDLSWITTGEVLFNGKTYATGRKYDDISGGYLFELSLEYDEVSEFKTDSGLIVMLSSPEYLVTNPEMMNYVVDFWNSFEKAYCSENGYVQLADGSSRHYTEYADIDSMVEYWLVNEVMGNFDAVQKSRYAYLDMDSKLKYGPVWDFDWGCGFMVVDTSPAGWKFTLRNDYDQGFYKDFLDDPLFIAKATEKYWEIRPYLQTLIDDGGILDQNTEYLLESGRADEALWDRNVTWPDRSRGFEGDAAYFKNYLTTRIAWMDKKFAADTTLLNSTRIDLSAYPYVRSDKLTIEALNGSSDTAEHAPAEAVISNGSDLSLKVGVSDAATVSIEAYVNGLYYDDIRVEDGCGKLSVDKARLDAGLGKKNVVSLIGKNSAGETTCKNFTTVKTAEPSFRTQSLVLSGQLGLNFFLDLSALTDEEREASYVEFTVNDKTAIDRYDPDFMNQTGEYYGFTCCVSSVEMADTIKAVFNYGDEAISKTYSVLDYINAIEGNAEAYDAETIELMHSIADYGHYAQPFLAENNDWTVGREHTEMDKHFTDGYASADGSYDDVKAAVSDHKPESDIADTDISGVTFSLSLNTETSLNVYIAPEETYSGSVSISVDGLEEGSYTVEELPDGSYKVVIPEISEHYLGTKYTVRIRTYSGTSAYRVSALSYVYSVLASDGFDQTAKNAVSAIYSYYAAAEGYRLSRQ